METARTLPSFDLVRQTGQGVFDSHWLGLASASPAAYLTNPAALMAPIFDRLARLRTRNGLLRLRFKRCAVT